MEKRGWRRGDGDAVMGTWGWGCGAGDVGTGDSGDGVAGWTQHRVAPLHPAALGPTHPSLLLLPALLRLNPRLLLPAGTGAQCRLRLHLRVPGTARGHTGTAGTHGRRAQGRGRSRLTAAPRCAAPSPCSAARAPPRPCAPPPCAPSPISCAPPAPGAAPPPSAAPPRAAPQGLSGTGPRSPPRHPPTPPHLRLRPEGVPFGAADLQRRVGLTVVGALRSSGAQGALQHPRGPPAPSRFPAPLTTNSSLSVGGVLLVLGAAAGASCASARLSPSCVTSSARRALSTAVASWQRDGDGVGPTAP